MSWSFLLGLPVLFANATPSYILRYAVLEPVTNVFYISLFVFLPPLVFSPKNLPSFTRRFFLYSLVILFIGFVDFYFSSRGILFLGRSIFERVDVGSRFHSIINEPRDYAVFAAYILAVYSLFNIFIPKRSFQVNLLLFTSSSLYFLSFLLTKSATSLVGILIFIILAAILLISRWLLRTYSFTQIIFILSCLFLVSFALASFATLDSSLFDILPIRISKYIGAFTRLLSVLGSASRSSILYIVSSSNLLTVQTSTFLPLLDFINLSQLTFPTSCLVMAMVQLLLCFQNLESLMMKPSPILSLPLHVCYTRQVS